MQVLMLWNILKDKPLGKYAFSKSLSLFVPYTGSTSPQVLELRPGFARVGIEDTRKIRNHLNCIHAAALMNIAEVSSGLALMACLSVRSRAILVQFTIDYLKKARGPLTSECQFEPPTAYTKCELEIVSEVKNKAGEIVARAKAKWLIDSMSAS